jgi:hypothetical protein
MADSDEAASSGTPSASGAGAKLHYSWNAATKAREAELAAAGAAPAAPTPLAAAGDAPSAPAASPGGGGGTGASQWNKAGTWESRDVTSRAHASLRSAVESRGAGGGGAPLASLAPAGAAGAPWALRLAGVSALTGSATLVFSRGRAKPGYELCVTLGWEATDAAGGRAAAGTAAFTDVSDVEGADVWASWRVAVDDVAPGAAAAKDAVAAAVRARADAFRDVFKEWAAGLAAL